MSKKAKIIIIVLVVVGLLAIGVYFFLPHFFKGADSEINKASVEEVEEKITTKKGKEINSMDGVQGTFVSKKTDPVTTELFFKTEGVTATTGRFKDLEIELSTVEDSTRKLSVVIQAESIYTANSERDSHLKEEDFFHVEKYPEITFESDEIIKGDTSYIAVGKISFMGASKDFKVPFSYLGPKSGKENVHIFEGKFLFNRVSHGMSEDSSIGNMVTVEFYTELHKK